MFGKEIEEMWSLRKAGLGLLANMPGDPKSVACVEDTAVALEDLPEYIDDFEAMMQDYGQESHLLRSCRSRRAPPSTGSRSEEVRRCQTL